MAIRIFEMADAAVGNMPVRAAPFRASQTGVVGATSVQSAAFSGATNFVSVQSDEACHVVFGKNPTSTTAGFKIAAGDTQDFGVEPGDKVAWIAA